MEQFFAVRAASDGEKENACPNFFGRRASVLEKQVRENGTEWGCKSSFQKTEVSEKKVGLLARIGWNKGAFVGDWAWNRKCREKSDGKRGRRPPNISAAPLIMPYYLLGATILRAFVGKKIK